MTVEEPVELHLNPGSVPEARQLAELSDGLAQVRAIIARETMGAISPRTQLFAVDALMQRHHDAIASLIGASVRRHNRVLSPDDAFQLVISLFGHATTAGYWLQLAQPFRKIPVEKPTPRDESIAKSKEHREAVLARIKTTQRLALETMKRLKAISPPEMEADAMFESLQFQLLCTLINGTISARTSASGGSPIPTHQLDFLAAQLEEVRSRPAFSAWSASQQNLFWITLARIQETAGHAERVRETLRTRRATTPLEDDSRPRLLMELLGYASDARERLLLMGELRELPDTVNLGSIFSRERIGRMSVLHDAFWSAVVATPIDDPLAGQLLDVSFECSRNWLFGRTIAPTKSTISIASSWQGGGRFAWGNARTRELRSFDLPPELPGELYAAMERTSSTEPKALREAVAYLDRTLSPLLAEAEIDGDVRLRTGGLVGLLPILATLVDGEALGTRVEIAIDHPALTEASIVVEERRFDLVVVDQCFARDAAEVVTAGRRVASIGSEPTVLAFNSDDQSTALDPLTLANELQRSRRTLIYSHVRLAVTQANWAGFYLGPSSALTVADLLELDLSSTEEIVLIGCASGRANPFVGDVTVAHAAALAGAEEVFSTLWPIRPKLGSQVAVHLINEFRRGQSMSTALSLLFRRNRLQAAPFVVMRP